MRLPAATAAVVTLILAGLSATSAMAAEDFAVTQFDAAAASTQAGAHSDVTTTIAFKSERYVEPFPGFSDTLPNDGGVRTTALDLPPGLLANAAKAPTCRRADFANGQCPIETQVGNGVVTTSPLVNFPTGLLFLNPIYNIAPASGQPASLGLMVGSSRLPAYIDIGVHSAGDYHVTATSTNIETLYPIKKLEVTLWGVPADPAHDSQRLDAEGYIGNPSPAPRTPFMVNPTDCDTTPVTTLRATSYGGSVATATAESPKPTDCDQLTFQPVIKLTPDTTAPDAPAGLGVELTFPQNDDPDGLATPALRTAVVNLPEGMTINPGAADGLTACSDAQSAIGTEDAASCPESAKIGTVAVDVPALRKPLDGALYVGSQQSGDPTSGKMFRFFLVANDQGIRLKLEGTVRADPVTGQLRATFASNPQVPVSAIRLAFKGGPRAVLANPPTCGAKTATAHLTSWGGPAADLQSSFAIDCTPGLGGFSPSFAAGVTDPIAGASAPFTLGITKPDGNAALDGLRLELPEGLLADIKGNLGTRVGTATVAAGPGSNPYSLSGPVVLEGAYGDAPYSLRVTVPAKAGPFDLGDVVVRQKIYVDPRDAHVTVVSDPLPTIVKGVPVRLQKLNVTVDKPGFMRNPTSCAEKTIGGDLHSVAGTTAHVTSRFQIGGCEGLALQPKLGLTLTGRGQTTTASKRSASAKATRVAKKAAATSKSLGLTDGGHPDLDAHLTMSGGANLKKTTVTLPLTMALDPDNANGLCEPADAAANKCPATSIVGDVTAISPILPDPLTGPVYFVRGERVDAKTQRVIKTLPKLYVPLTGSNGVRVDLHASSDVNSLGQLVTTFDNIPDAPVSDFKLHIAGGRHGILVVTLKDLCAASADDRVGEQDFTGQNGKAVLDELRTANNCPFAISKSSHTASALRVSVSGVPLGKVTASGNGVRSASKTISNDDNIADLSLPMSKAVRSKLAKGANVKVKVRVSYKPKGATKTKKITKTLVIHGAKKKQ